MDIKDVKLGMTVKIVKNPPQGRYGYNQVGNNLIITHAHSQLGIFGASGFTGEFGGKHGYIACQYFEPAAFTKDMLKTGMRVVYRDGTKRVVVYTLLFDTLAASRGVLGAFSTALISSGQHDIMEVYAAPASCEDFFNLEILGGLLFKREEGPKKTEKQLQAEELMKKADALKAQFEALVKQATALAEG